MKTRAFVEKGARKVFVGALDWPGWARGAKSESEALDAFVRYGERYRRSAGAAARPLTLPATVDDVEVVARLEGGSGTDFGIPSTVVDFDRADVTERDLSAQIELLRAAWRAFERAAHQAEGKPLATGPRGGGRSLDKIREHVREADRAYISSLGAKAPRGEADWKKVQTAFIEAVHAKLRGELPEKGPRGGERWPARYAIRRSAWHALDHAWEIEDRLTG